MNGVLYKATSPNGKCYIGQTVNFFKRYREHRDLYKRLDYPETQSKFYKALRKYGFENFEWEILCFNLDKDSLNVKEKEQIEIFNSFIDGYNSTLGGESYMLSEEHKRKIGQAQKGNKNHNFGKKASIETRKKMSDSRRGVRRGPMSEEMKKRISDTKKKKGKTFEEIFGVEKTIEIKQKIRNTKISRGLWHG